MILKFWGDGSIAGIISFKMLPDWPAKKRNALLIWVWGLVALLLITLIPAGII